MGTTPLESHFQQVIERAPLDLDGEDNNYHAPTFIARLAKYFLPHATLWSGLMLGRFSKISYYYDDNNIKKLHTHTH